MGARLVTLVLMRWPHVSDRAFRVLVRMAHTALDEPGQGTPAHLYFGGRDLLADVLRSDGDRDTVYRTVKRAIAELVEAGAIERVAAGRAGRHAVYRMTLAGARSIDTQPVDNPATPPRQGDTSSPPEGDTSDPPQGDTSSPVRGTPAVPPRNHEEPLKELEEERKTVVRTAVTGTRARETAQTPIPAADAAERLPGRCPHGLTSRRRPDGRPSCAICRRGQPSHIRLAETA